MRQNAPSLILSNLRYGKPPSVIMVQTEGTSASAAAPPQPPPQRRPRVREVSSRFMSPSPHSSSSNFGDPSKSPLPSQQQRSVSAQRQRRRLEMEGDENRPLETQRSLESPFTSTNTHKKHHITRTSSDSVKLSARSTPLKPDTPIFHTVDTSRIRPNPRAATSSAAAKLLQSNGIGMSMNASSSSDLRSSMPEADHLPSIASRFLSERNLNRGNESLKPTASPFSRSLNSPFITSESVKGGSIKAGVVSLPPVPKSGADARKAKKVCSHQEDVHSLKLLHNHWLQLRFANAKAEAAMKAQKRETERTFYSLGVKMSTLHDSVKEKRIELGHLQRVKALTTILEDQMPYLDMWSALEGDYSNSLSEAAEALSNTSLRLPVSGNVRADVREVGEAMNSAAKLMGMIFSHVQSFLPKAEEMEKLMLELARVTGGEKALVEECGEQLSVTFASQVEEMSLRSQLIQLNQSCQRKSSLCA